MFPLIVLMAGLAVTEPASQPASDVAPAITDIEQLSLDDLLNPTVEVATQTALKVTDTPGVLTVITREEIAHSGARYLLDLLQLVPGFGVGVDVEGVVGLGFRGLWGHEGKILLLLDGVEMNEVLYATTELGSHYPLDEIERVEIIRGPGSAVYGGYAELAVINMITRDGEALSGVAGNVAGSMYSRSVGNLGGGLAYGMRSKEDDYNVSAHAFFGGGPRSDGVYTDHFGVSYPMAQNSGLTSMLLNVGAEWKKLRVRIIYDDYHIGTRDGAIDALPAAYDEGFRSFVLSVRREFDLTPRLVLTPRIDFKLQQPWRVEDETSDVFFDKTAYRLVAGATLGWKPIDPLDFLFGAEGRFDHARLNSLTLNGFQTDFQGEPQVSYGNFAAFLQLVFTNFIVNVTAGARFEYHSSFGASFVPRVALTKVVDRFNFKLLFSQAFRAPAIENLNINPTIKPERVNVLEAEVGVKITPNMQLTANAFWGRIDRPIIYDVEPVTEAESYFNSTYTGSAGVEVDYRLRYFWGAVRVSYSFYSSRGQNDVELYRVAGRSDILLAFPAHKVTLNSNFNLWKDHLVLGLAGVLFSERGGMLSGDEDGNPVPGVLPPQLLLNASLWYHDLFVRGLHLGVGCNNIIGTQYVVPQPYNGGHGPLPMQSREFYVRLSFSTSGAR